MKRLPVIALGVLVCAAPGLFAAPYDEMDYGPFISATYQLPWPAGNLTLRGIAVSFDVPIEGEPLPTPPRPVKGKTAAAAQPARAGIVFDTELLRYSGYWNGGFITWNGVVFNGNHGANPGPAGTLRIATRATPGWAKDGKLDDPRSIPHGPLPRDWARYKGLYRHDTGVVFAYTVGATNVLDMPTVEAHDTQRLFVRTLNLSPSREERLMLIADLPKVQKMTRVRAMMMMEDDKNAVVAHVSGGPPGTELQPGSRMALKIPASTEPVRIRIGIWGGPKAEWEAGAKALDQLGQPIDLIPLTRGGQGSLHGNRDHQGRAWRWQGCLHGRFAHASFQEPVQIMDALRRHGLLFRRPGGHLHLER